MSTIINNSAADVIEANLHLIEESPKGIPGDGIRRDPDMDWMGWSAGIWLHGKILPFFTFSRLLDYIFDLVE